MVLDTTSRRDALKLLGTGAAASVLGSGIAAAGEDEDTVFAAELAPMGGVDSPAEGAALFHHDEMNDELNYALLVTDITNANMAHIHLDSGGVVTWLYPHDDADVGRPHAIPLELNGVLAHGTIAADNLTGPLGGSSLGDLVEEMAAGNTLVRVHTAQNMAGEIDGDVMSVDEVEADVDEDVDAEADDGLAVNVGSALEVKKQG
ncbi:MAG: CHRD domain-containing protein [Halolamina sp.]